MNTQQHRQFQRGVDAIRAAEHGPSCDELAVAPILDCWRVMIAPHPYPIPVLWGEVSGHPKLGTDLITTSRLVALDRHAGRARSVSRWYRLGRPFAEFEAALTSRMGQNDAKPGSAEFHLPGFVTIDDPAALEQILADYIALMRKIDANYKTGGGETRT